ncbi:MAG: hypothetical protein AB7T01_10395 [Acidithiobacillus sp.]
MGTVEKSQQVANKQFRSAPYHLSASVALDFLTSSGRYQKIIIPASIFDQLCVHLGNAHKVKQWIGARCAEVETLSLLCVEQYLNIMLRDKLGVVRHSEQTPRITVSTWQPVHYCSTDQHQEMD